MQQTPPLALIGLAIGLLVARAGATTIRVPQEAPTIQAGISASTDGDTVLVAPGTYSGEGNRAIDFMGRSITLMSESGSAGTVIDCDAQDRGFYFVNQEDSTAVVSGFTVREGSAFCGAGAYIQGGSSPRFCDVVISGCEAHYGGGAYILGGSSPTFHDVVISGCEAHTYGGGIYCHDSCSPVLTAVTLTDNEAQKGGGFYCDNWCSPKLRNVTLSNNLALDQGGGLWCHWNSSPHIAGATFTGNIADSKGGGMRCALYCAPVLTRVVFDGNAAHRGGGVYCDAICDLTIRESSFVGNQTTGVSGGLHVSGGSTTCTLVNSQFTGNTSGSSGGACTISTYAHAFLSHVVFSENSSSGGGGGGGLCCSAHAVAELNRATFFRNHAHSGGAVTCFTDGQVVLANCTLVENSTASGGVVGCSTSRQPKLSHTIIAFSDEGCAFSCAGSTPVIDCCDFYGNTGGDWVGPVAGFLGQDGNISADPRLCGGSDPFRMFMLESGSPCAEESNPECGLIGAWGVGCSAVAVDPLSWGALKARYR